MRGIAVGDEPSGDVSSVRGVVGFGFEVFCVVSFFGDFLVASVVSSCVMMTGMLK